MRIQKPLGTLCGLVFAVSLATLGISARHDGDAEPAQAKSMPTKGVTIVIELGLKDPEATGWAG